MRKLVRLGQLQKFQIETNKVKRFFGINRADSKTLEDAWILSYMYYFYMEEGEDITEAYKKKEYLREKNLVPSPYRSGNVDDIDVLYDRCPPINLTVSVIDCGIEHFPTFNELKNSMSGEDFAKWLTDHLKENPDQLAETIIKITCEK